MGVWILIVVGVAAITSIIWLPLANQMATNVTNMTVNPGMASMADTPLIPIINLWPIWVIGIIIIAIAWTVSQRT